MLRTSLTFSFELYWTAIILLFNTHICGRFGETALHLAIREGHEETVKYLIKAGASLHVTGKAGIPEQLSKACLRPEIIRYISEGSID